ncbi:MAG TPA: SMP-30/gluconolactonase/LRE family protein, partial [Sphingomicrobium sp.]
MSSEPRLVWDIAAELGEGPVWVARDRALWFTDIKRHKVHRY